MHAATSSKGTPSKSVSDQSAIAAFYSDAAHTIVRSAHHLHNEHDYKDTHSAQTDPVVNEFKA